MEFGGGFAKINLQCEIPIALRDDPDAMRKLRNLRLFLHSNYSDKPLSFVEDDLCRRIEEYQSTCRAHGLKLATSVLKSLTDAKNIQGLGVAVLVGAVVGGPVVAGAVAFAGCSVEVAQVALKVSEETATLEKYKEEHALAFVFEVRKRIAESVEKPGGGVI